MTQQGYSEKDLLVDTGITPKILQSTDYEISGHQYQTFVGNMLTLSKDDSLGFHCGENLSFMEMGIVGFVLVSAPTLRRALSLWFPYSNSLFGSLIESQVQEAEDEWYLQVDVALPMGTCYRFCLEEFLMLCRYTGESLMEDKIDFARLQLSYPKPRNISEYEQRFSCPIEFNAPHNRIYVRSPSLDKPIHANNADLDRVYNDFCEKMSHMGETTDPLIQRIRNLFIKTPERIPTLEEVAQNLNRSERTIRRHLKEKGFTYRKLVDDYRCDLAKQYLNASHLSLKEISFLLGYEDSKSFLRSFKRWTGMTVSDYRATSNRPRSGLLQNPNHP
jgi:AraC-like DNA-binding protein